VQLRSFHTTGILKVGRNFGRDSSFDSSRFSRRIIDEQQEDEEDLTLDEKDLDEKEDDDEKDEDEEFIDKLSEEEAADLNPYIFEGVESADQLVQREIEQGFLLPEKRKKTEDDKKDINRTDFAKRRISSLDQKQAEPESVEQKELPEKKARADEDEAIEADDKEDAFEDEEIGAQPTELEIAQYNYDNNPTQRNRERLRKVVEAQEDEDVAAVLMQAKPNDIPKPLLHTQFKRRRNALRAEGNDFASVPIFRDDSPDSVLHKLQRDLFQSERSIENFEEQSLLQQDEFWASVLAKFGGKFKALRHDDIEGRERMKEEVLMHYDEYTLARELDDKYKRPKPAPSPSEFIEETASGKEKVIVDWNDTPMELRVTSDTLKSSFWMDSIWPWLTEEEANELHQFFGTPIATVDQGSATFQLYKNPRFQGIGSFQASINGRDVDPAAQALETQKLESYWQKVIQNPALPGFKPPVWFSDRVAFETLISDRKDEWMRKLRDIVSVPGMTNADDQEVFLMIRQAMEFVFNKYDDGCKNSRLIEAPHLRYPSAMYAQGISDAEMDMLRRTEFRPETGVFGPYYNLETQTRDEIVSGIIEHSTDIITFHQIPFEHLVSELPSNVRVRTINSGLPRASNAFHREILERGREQFHEFFPEYVLSCDSSMRDLLNGISRPLLVEESMGLYDKVLKEKLGFNLPPPLPWVSESNRLELTKQQSDPRWSNSPSTTVEDVLRRFNENRPRFDAVVNNDLTFEKMVSRMTQSSLFPKQQQKSTSQAETWLKGMGHMPTSFSDRYIKSYIEERAAVGGGKPVRDFLDELQLKKLEKAESLASDLNPFRLILDPLQAAQGLPSAIGEAATENFPMGPPQSPMDHGERFMMKRIQDQYEGTLDRVKKELDDKAKRLIKERENPLEVFEEEFEDRKRHSKSCPVCKDRSMEELYSPLNVSFMSTSLTTLGHIMPRRMTGMCGKHQRRMAKTIKRALHLGVFSYKDNDFNVNSPFQKQWLHGKSQKRSAFSETLRKMRVAEASAQEYQNSFNETEQ